MEEKKQRNKKICLNIRKLFLHVFHNSIYLFLLHIYIYRLNKKIWKILNIFIFK